jgi:hypothetical protein
MRPVEFWTSKKKVKIVNYFSVLKGKPPGSVEGIRACFVQLPRPFQGLYGGFLCGFLNNVIG